MLLGPTMVPQNFALEEIIDHRTARFRWDPITDEQANNPNSGMRGRLAGFLVV